MTQNREKRGAAVNRDAFAWLFKTPAAVPAPKADRPRQWPYKK